MDLISRQAAIDAIQKDRETGWKDSEDDAVYRNACDDGYAYSMQIISELPSAERKTGKWIEVDGTDYERFCKCSVCGCGSDSLDTVYKPNFCPNCGARMEVSDE